MRITTRKTKYYKTKNALWCLSKWASSLPVQNSSKFGWFSLKPRWRAGRTRSRKRVHRLKGRNRSPKARIGTFLSSDSAYDSAAYSVVKTKGINQSQYSVPNTASCCERLICRFSLQVWQPCSCHYWRCKRRSRMRNLTSFSLDHNALHF